MSSTSLLARRAARAISTVALAAGFAALAAPASHAAATLTVTKTADTNDAACTVADCSLREAMAVAGTDDTIIVPAGTYKASMLGGNGVWSPSGTFTLQGAGAGATIIDGNQLSRTFALYGTVTMRGVTVTGGKGPAAGCSCGGGFQVRQGGVLALEDSIVEGNWAPSGGGGINVDSQSRATLKNVVLRQNSSPSGGGGLRVDPTSGINGVVTMTNVTFDGNFTTGGAAGGGIYNDGTITTTNATLSGNTTQGDGGAILNAATGVLSLRSSTLANNSATGLGAGIRNLAAGGAVTLRNTILADAAANECSSVSAPAVTSLGHNLALGATCALTGPGDLPSTDPKLGPLAAGGGNGLPVHAPQAGSPALDAGDTSACLTFDARDLPRPSGAACDIGAVEFQVPPVQPQPPVQPLDLGPQPSPGTQTPAPAPAPAPAARCTVPKLTGRTLASARRALTRAGCATGRVRKPKRVRRGAKLVVAAQSVKAGRRVARGTKVALRLGVKPAKHHKKR